MELSLNIQQANINIHIDLDEISLDGGVYMFLIDDIPLYIGEANIFLRRLTDHLYKLRKNPSYFGLRDLQKQHNITYIILESGYPYEADEERKEKEKLKKTPDKNTGIRQQKQNKYIDHFYPLIQNPKFYPSDKLKKKDYMIKGSNKKNKIVKEALSTHMEEYKKIIEEIKCL